MGSQRDDNETEEHDVRRMTGRRSQDRDIRDQLMYEFEKRAQAQEAARREHEERVKERRMKRFTTAAALIGPLLGIWIGTKADIGYLQQTPNNRLATLETRVTTLEAVAEDVKDRSDALLILRCLDSETDPDVLRAALGRIGLSCASLMSDPRMNSYDGDNGRMRPMSMGFVFSVPKVPSVPIPPSGGLTSLEALPAGKRWPWTPLSDSLFGEV